MSYSPIADAMRLSAAITETLHERPSEVASALALAQQLTAALVAAQAEVTADPEYWS